MRRLTTLAFLLLLLPSAWSDGPPVNASRMWVRAAAPGVSVLAGYFTLTNVSDKPLKLTSVTSPDFTSAEVHRSFVKDGMEGMEPVDAVSIPAHGSTAFEPGSYHVMLMQPKKNLGSGDTVALSLNFSDGWQLNILAPVRRDPPQH